MKKKSRRILRVISFLILILLVGGAIRSVDNKKHKWMERSEEIADYEEGSLMRVNKSVITLPEEDVLVGLKDGIGTYTSKMQKADGVITVKSEFLKTQFVLGEYEKKDPRQDVVVPAYISTDSHGGSMYVILFNDRGDAAIEKSYARLGGKNIVIQDIRMLQFAPENKEKQEYLVDIFYKSEGLDSATGSLMSKSKEVIIPVVDGHFDPENTVSR